MNSIIDAHVHIMPGHLQGTTDERFGVRMDEYGCKVLPNGFPASFLPNYMQKSEFSTDALLHVLETEKVERAVIMQSLCFKINEDVANAVQKNPDKLKGAMIIEPKDVSVLDEIRRWNEEGLTVIKFEMSEPFGFTHPNAYPDLDFDSDLFHDIYRLAGELGLTVTIDTSPIGTKGYQTKALHHAASIHKNTKFVICHMAFPFVGMDDHPEKKAQWEEMVSLAAYDNVWFDLAAMPAIFREEEYPHRSAIKFIREFADQYGAKKMIWGSDIPGTYVDATYKQMIHMYTEYKCFSQEELQAMFYDNAKEVYFDGR